MSEDASAAQPSKLFICCFEFSTDQDLASLEDDDNEDGTFQLVVEARDVDDAATKCRARLHEIATTTGTFGHVVVYVNAFIEVAPSDLARGVVINHQKFGAVIGYNYLPRDVQHLSLQGSVEVIHASTPALTASKPPAVSIVTDIQQSSALRIIPDWSRSCLM